MSRFAFLRFSFLAVWSPRSKNRIQSLRTAERQISVRLHTPCFLRRRKTQLWEKVPGPPYPSKLLFRGTSGPAERRRHKGIFTAALFTYSLPPALPRNHACLTSDLAVVCTPCGCPICCPVVSMPKVVWVDEDMSPPLGLRLDAIDAKNTRLDRGHLPEEMVRVYWDIGL